MRLAGPATPGLGDGDLVTPELHDALTRLAGVYTIEVSGDELTLFGSHGLDVTAPGRVEAAFALADALAARAHAVLASSQRPGAVGAVPESTASGTLIPAAKHHEPTKARTRGPLTIIGWTLALVIGGPIAIAVVMSIVDDHLRGNRLAARIVVLLVVAAALALVARVGKAAVTHRRPARRRASPADPCRLSEPPTQMGARNE